MRGQWPRSPPAGNVDLEGLTRPLVAALATIAGLESTTPGIGLGLHIVRNLLEAMGGTVTAETNPWRGSTFTVFLPHREDPSTYPSDSAEASSTTA